MMMKKYYQWKHWLQAVRIDLPPGLSIKHAVAELLATAIFVFIGVGTAITINARPIAQTVLADIDASLADVQLATISRVNLYMGSWAVNTALAFGLAIIVLAYATAGLSGGQMNPAVAFGLAFAGALSWKQAAANSVAQIAGAILGAAFLAALVPGSVGSGLGSNRITPGVGAGSALCGEIIMTMVLVLVVLQTTVSGKEMVQQLAPLAIGFAVFCAHALLLPIDGCSINPARSLGPAIISGTWPPTFWVFIVGPYLGAIAAVPVHFFFTWEFERVAPPATSIGKSMMPRKMFSMRQPAQATSREREISDYGFPSLPLPPTINEEGKVRSAADVEAPVL